MNKRRFLSRSLATLTAGFAGTLSFAQTYPTKPIRLVVPFPPGGATDLFARTVSQKLAERLGQAVVVENRPGAGGTLGSDIVAKAAADGYTLLLSTSSTHSIGPNLNPKIPYDAVRDFTPISHLGNAPSIMLVPNASPAKTVKEWIDHARKNPGRLNYASSGNGTIVHLTAELFKSQANVFVLHIPYRGTALAIPDLVSGKIDVLFDSLPTGLPHVREGRLRALGVTSAKRTPLAPELPPISDVLPGYESVTWFGLFGPRGLPADMVQRLNTAASQVLGDPDAIDRLTRLGIEPAGGSAAQFSRMLAGESAKWKKIIDERKITLE
ncbi:MAG: tripartite tricarboxylate transporter substrate binding protein [Betaproteobacteria bacterium]|nr:tripartite tricarboxylate transporter substrate binding protein [Betaproteobacteria bacterium]